MAKKLSAVVFFFFAVSLYMIILCSQDTSTVRINMMLIQTATTPAFFLFLFLGRVFHPYIKHIDECKEGTVCKCDGCSCKNTCGGFDCKCKGNKLYIAQHDTCIERQASKFGWFLSLLIIGIVVGVGLAGYIFYKYRLRSYMDSEIMAIMSQYMPLDSQQNQVVLQDSEPLAPRHGSSV